MNSKYIKFIFFIIALLILGFFFSSELRPIKDFFSQVFSPIGKRILTTSNSMGGFFSNLSQISNLASQNSSLEKENNEIKAELVLLKEVQHENEVLKKEIGFTATQKERELIPCKVISASPSSFFQTIRIDKGTKDGVTNGKAVLSGGFLIGTIQEAADNSSQVFLITNSQSLVAVILQESRGSGLLKGGLKGLTVENIPLDTPIKKGEIVITSGLGDGLLSGIAIGTVQDIISSQSEIFQRVNVESPIELGKIEIVFVIK